MYCRKSSEAEDRQILSIDSQISEMRRYAAQKGLKIHSILTEARSAKAPGRPIFNSMMERLYRGEADGILCWKLDRLARNPVDGGSIIWALKEHGMSIITPFQSYGHAQDNTVWMYLEFGMAQKYVDDLSRNVKRGLRSKAEMGWQPGPTPPGYLNKTNDEGRNVIVTDPERFEIIRRCWDLMLAGAHTPAEIRNIANTVWGYKTMNGNPLGRNTIYSIFANPFYHGIYEYPRGSDRWHTGRHTPMVSEVEFDAVQKLLNRSKQMPKNRKVFAFTGLIQCGTCGGAVTAEEKHQLVCSVCKFKFAHRTKETCPKCRTVIKNMTNPTRRSYTYYHCARSANPYCTERGIEKKELECQVVQYLKRVTMPDVHRHWLNTNFRRLQPGNTTEALPLITDSFVTHASAAQREIVMAIFATMTLKDRKLTVSLKPPFSFVRETELSANLNQKPLGTKALQEQESRA
jgi:DNA invertase Pin-like site-specific DNA recombinase